MVKMTLLRGLLLLLAFQNMACSGGTSKDDVLVEAPDGSSDLVQQEVVDDVFEGAEEGGPISLPVLQIEDVPGEHAKLGSVFTKYVNIFGIHIFATADTSDHKVLHAAHVMAQYLDNDEDGTPDHPGVVSELVKHNATLLMTRTQADFEKLNPEKLLFPEYEASQLLFGEETRPEGSSSENGFDATLEEVLHLITSIGFASAKPVAFGEQQGSTIAKCMDLARGGQFLSIPDPYPSEAWYHYDDWTCDYRCMVTEYFYWALTSLLGAQDYPGRAQAIANEWELPTPALVESGDPCVYELLMDPLSHVPSVLPDGSYGSD
jgi:hypothetical protein